MSIIKYLHDSSTSRNALPLIMTISNEKIKIRLTPPVQCN